METFERPPIVKTAGVTFPAAPGTYALLLYLREPAILRVGKLGLFTLPAQDYIYFGSAFGPGGLRGRTNRHLRRDKRPHWHIDALTRIADIDAVWHTTSHIHLECRWCQALSLHDTCRYPIIGFGASDCTSGCPAHLLALTEPAELDALTEMFTAASAGDPVFVQRCSLSRSSHASSAAVRLISSAALLA